jgi:hypothetical protein
MRQELKLSKINCHSLPNPFSGSCKYLIDFRLPEQLHQTDSARTIVVKLERQIPGASYSSNIPEFHVYILCTYNVNYEYKYEISSQEVVKNQMRRTS